MKEITNNELLKLSDVEKCRICQKIILGEIKWTN